jgi:pimeloyl-ACP methyl ester carboxylesterase
MKQFAIMLTGLCLLPQMTYASEADLQPSREFHALFTQALPPTQANSPSLHYILDSSLERALSEPSIEFAMRDAAESSIQNLAQNTSESQNVPINSRTPIELESLTRKSPVTIVIVPGIFGEFIKTRAFEEVFARNSSFAQQFKKLVQAAASAKSELAFDESFGLNNMQLNRVGLENVVNAASIDDSQGHPLIRVVLLYTPFLSLETLDDVEDQARFFNRRLEKYLALTGDQNIALLGYSRGTTTALAMVAQANEQNRPWLKMVKGVVSLGGVVLGSSLADQIADQNSPQGKLISYVRELRSQLKTTEDLPQGGWWQDFRNLVSVVSNNNRAWTSFMYKASLVAPSMLASPQANSADSQDLAGSPLTSGLDPRDPVSLLGRMFYQFGLTSPLAGYSANVLRFKTFIDHLLTGVDQLRTETRKTWWSTHLVPTNGITYYSLAATMADPEHSPLERQLFDGHSSYSGSYDDKSLLQNHRDYFRLSGVNLNDSQVAVAQAMFLPNVIQGLNPRQQPMMIENLGVLSTHHWGLALQVVNEMRDKRVNPFPREAVLKALAAQIALDQIEPLTSKGSRQ